MFRIKTRSDNKSVLTLYFNVTNEWVTIIKVTVDGKTTVTSTDATNPYDAGQNHLQAFLK